MPQHLRHDHDELRAIMRRFAAAMQSGRDAARSALLRDRVAFSQLFRQHLAEEQSLMRNMLDTTLRQKASDELHQLFRDYSAHVSAWTPQRIEAEWDGYVEAVLALQRRLLDRLAWGDRELLPHLGGSIAA